MNRTQIKTALPEKTKSPFMQAVERFFKNKPAAVALFVITFIALCCYILPLFLTTSPFTIDMSALRKGPSREHILGTDTIGRDLFTRLLYGGRVTFGIMIEATVVAAVVGSAVGIVSGFFGGRTDFYLMRVMEIVASVPGILLAVMLEVGMGFGGGYFRYGLAISAMPAFARLLRATVMSIMKSEYIEAARALGAKSGHIMLKHILHNVAAPMIIQTLSCAADMLINCTIMGYLGLGITPPTPEWGGIVYDTKDYLRSLPYITLIPSGLIVVCEMSLHFIGNGLRDALDPGGREA